MQPATLHPSSSQFAGHETFPLRQLWLRKAYIAVADGKDGAESAKRLFAEEAAIRRFGVGKNMVSSIRHWALACDVLRNDRKGGLVIGEVGELLFGRRGVDLYLERPATAWLVHWLLAGRAERSTTWYWIFNRVLQQTFTRAEILTGLEAFAKARSARATKMTLRRDIETCLRCYLPRADGETDDASEPLLVDLGLFSEGPGDALQFRRGQHASLPDGVFAYALVEFWKRWEEQTGSGQRTLSFDSIAYEYGSPGRVFKLDENAVAERLMNLEQLTNGTLRWSDTAGVRNVSIQPDEDRAKLMQKVLRGAYEK